MPIRFTTSQARPDGGQGCPLVGMEPHRLVEVTCAAAAGMPDVHLDCFLRRAEGHPRCSPAGLAAWTYYHKETKKRLGVKRGGLEVVDLPVLLHGSLAFLEWAQVGLVAKGLERLGYLTPDDLRARLSTWQDGFYPALVEESPDLYWQRFAELVPLLTGVRKSG